MKGITDNAGKMLKTALEEADAPEELSVRFELSQGEGKLRLDMEQPADHVFEYGERKVLLVSPAVAEACAGSTLDYNEEGFRFL